MIKKLIAGVVCGAKIFCAICDRLVYDYQFRLPKLVGGNNQWINRQQSFVICHVQPAVNQ